MLSHFFAHRKLSLLVYITVFGLISGVGFSGSALAADFDLGAIDITTPTGDWLEIKPGEKHMYEFSYDSFEQVDGYTSEAIVSIKSGDKDSVRFSVYSTAQIEEWQRGGDLRPTGVGARLSESTRNAKDDVRVVWRSQSDASQYYYVVVENGRPIASYYEIKITGSGVALVKTEAMLAEEKAAEEAAAEAAQAAGENSEEVAVPTGPITLEQGLGPDDALAPPMGQEILLNPGETRWFTFRYYRDAGKDATQVIALLKMPVANTVGFEIWNQDTVRKWANSEKFQPVGAGTPIGFGKDFGKDLNTLVWVSSAEAGQQYFLIVKNKSQETASFRLTITGPKISY